MIGLDTNVLLRYATQDDAVQSAQAQRFFDEQLKPGTNPGHISLVTLAECVWVLNSHFKATRQELIEFVQELLADPRFVVQDEFAVWHALEAIEDTPTLDLPDALIVFVDRLHGCSHTVTFDRRAARIPGMVLLD